MIRSILIKSRPIPSDPPRRRGATSLETSPSRFQLFKAILAAVPWSQVVIGAAIVLLAALVPWGTGQVLSAMDRQVMAIDITGDLVGESRVALERSAGQWVGRSFFATDLSDVKEKLEQRPWVETAAVKRVWPDRLAIEVREKKPLAYWSDGRLVSRAGEVFAPPNPEVAGKLPMLSGPDERVMEVIRMAQTMSDTLAEYELGFAGLSLEQRGAWTLTLSNGIEVVLGRDQVNERFDRFVTVYQERLVSRASEVKRVDARYSNGVAVKWKLDEAVSGKNS
ncbi:cell division protein FtsQ/DivIB [Marinobacter sp. CHS3-4]|uniref:cell division protein FtsQ/DivIB n=1 Tax=Marinobacter sp. CHS3-4 TaxID=3045174 RepID=UPI0024B574A1|nr:cell division protein FtsQ/DivIB [Marinobacter sp. CHS3-4]MDI9246260.1 cell division protein FtsQ/DivIB [Marinobacter sp. CHS3-4]